MTINSLQYNGLCSCGREHQMQTELCIVESGCLKKIDAILAENGLSGYTVAVYDENTYRATADRHPHADKEVILSPEGLHANEKGVALLSEQLPREAELLIAVGAGTVHDLTRYCAYQMGIPFVSCPTAASVDGFCSSVAAMTWHGCKKTLTAVAPRLVVADVDVIKAAPMRMTRSGFGDMIGKYVALTDWRIAHTLTGEFYCDRIADMTLSATAAVVDAAEGILRGEDAAYEKLTYGLLLSGLAMQMMGNSRPASGAEHHVSHLIEMEPESLGLRSDALHGEKVGVGTLLVAAEYHRLKKEAPVWQDYRATDAGEITRIFGDYLAPSIVEENEKDAAQGITAAAVTQSWRKICAIIDDLPTPDALLAAYRTLSVKATLSRIGVAEEKAPLLLSCSPLVRNRLTLMRLRRALENEINPHHTRKV
ncbi:MAG: sn-glycerol-1-phosphate dehydrogenase [Clostridia bacterium]|nr:sn-glycerol-1-phosphate dehydrogenase [Clostridia bacterium]